MRRERQLAGLAAAVLVLAVLVFYGIPRWRRGGKPPQEYAAVAGRALALETYSLFDMGVADVDGDGNLDIFTTNHNARGTLALGDGRGGFADALASWGLSQDPHFPAAEDADREPEATSTGLYIYWYQRKLHLRVHGMDNAPGPAGRLEVPSPLTVRTQQGFRLDTATSQTAGLTHTALRFQARAGPGDKLLVLRPRFIGVRVSFQLDDRLPLASVFVGAQRISPPAHRFSLFLKDRHGLAWADWDGDGRMDLFIARGGLKGEMNRFPETFRDELFRNTGRSFQEVTRGSGLDKKNCRARQAAWIDFDRDGRLDLYVSCLDGPDQLHRQVAPGRFSDVAAAAGLAEAEDGLSVWLDADGDADLDLFIAGQRSFWLYRNDGGRFVPVRLGPSPGAGQPTVADIDGDGHLDVFVASRRGNALLLNTGGAFRPQPPAALGLPAAALTANWVDYDNDGLPDLHLVPGGLYRQRPDGRFEATGLFDPQREAGSPIVDARATWADFDNDGFRDLLLAVLEEKNRRARRWTVRLYRNPGFSHGWLALDLIGPPGNRQAIGARVELRTARGKQIVQMVGSAEGSRYSQGHYRLYFGLGEETLDSLRVLWPDGKTQELHNPPRNSRTTISYQPTD